MSSASSNKGNLSASPLEGACSNREIKAQARRLGFVACGMAKAEPVPETVADYYRRWLALGNCADMDYMRRNIEMRFNPELLVPGVRTIVSLAINFMPSRQQPAISLYAQGKDYHDVMKERMRQLMEALGLEGRCFVDTAPVMERYWAWRCGVGEIRRSGMVSVPGYGPTVFLGELFLTADADQYDKPLGEATVPTEGWQQLCPALTPDGLDARRCMSYMTIEHRGPLPDDLPLRQTFYGCDRCLRATQDFPEAHPTEIIEFEPSEALLSMTPDDWKSLTIERYRELFRGSAVKRAKYEGLMRNINHYYSTSNH